jgi:hypothetical protein
MLDDNPPIFPPPPESPRPDPGGLFQGLGKHWAVVVSVTYLVGSLLGLLYHWTLLGVFGVNFLDYAKLDDLMLGMFKSLPMILFGLTILLIQVSVQFVFDSDGERRLPLRVRIQKQPRYLKFGVFIATISIALIIPPDMAFNTANKVKACHHEVVHVSLRQSPNGTGIPVENRRLCLIEMTSTTAFFYDKDRKTTVAVLRSNLVTVDYLRSNTPVKERLWAWYNGVVRGKAPPPASRVPLYTPNRGLK